MKIVRGKSTRFVLRHGVGMESCTSWQSDISIISVFSSISKSYVNRPLYRCIKVITDTNHVVDFFKNYLSSLRVLGAINS